MGKLLGMPYREHNDEKGDTVGTKDYDVIVGRQRQHPLLVRGILKQITFEIFPFFGCTNSQRHVRNAHSLGTLRG